MTIEKFEKDLAAGESVTVEFKSWIKAKDMRERISLAVEELIAFANTKGGVLYFGVEDNGEVTGCEKYDCQKSWNPYMIEQDHHFLLKLK